MIKPLSQAWRSFLLLLACVVGMALGPMPRSSRLLAQTDQTLQECSAVDEATLQDELNRVTQQVFARALAEIDLALIVDTEWQRLEIDAVLQREVDRAVVRVQSEKALWDTFLSAWSGDKAAELTRAVAAYTFESEAFAGKLDELSQAVADRLSQQIAVLSAESVSAAFYCLQTFIADNYAGVLVRKFEEQVQSATQAVDVGAAGELDSSILAVLDQHRSALGGVGVIIGAQIARRVMINVGEEIAERVVGRIVGRVLGRIGTEVIPLVGWVVGTGLIAYDIYANRDGALPQIQAQLKSAQVQAGIRAEIVAAMEPEFRREAPQIAREVANDLFSQWRDVRRNIRQVLELSAADPAFQAILNGLESTDDLAKLVNLVGVARPALGEAGFQQAVADGSLAQVLKQPASAAAIIESTQSIDTALAWSVLAGDRLDEVVAFELYKHMTPSQLTRPLLERLLALDNRAAIEKLALLDAGAIESLLNVSTSNLTALAMQLSPEALKTVADYLPLLDQDQRNQLISQIASNPQLVDVLANDAVRQRIATGRNLDATLSFLSSPTDWTLLPNQLGMLFTGKVNLALFVYKYGAGQSALLGIALLLILLIAIRIIYGLGAWLVSPVTRLFGRSD